MAKKTKPQERVVGASGALTHNPFAALAGRIDVANTVATPAPAPPRPPPAADPTADLHFPAKVLMRRETHGRSGKTVTRLSGIPVSQLPEVAARLRRALGCGATVEGEDVILQGDLEQRARAWLLAQGAKRLAQGNTAAPSTPEPALPRAAGPESRATVRSNIRRGSQVAVVLKRDQETGELTAGVVSDLLTSSPRHPRGIKVRLDSGAVGRVQRILE